MSNLTSTFKQNLNICPQQLEAILKTSLGEFLNSRELQATLNSLDTNLLRATLPTAGQVLAEELPPFYHWLKHELGLKRVPDSPDHTTKWVINFLNNQESLMHLVELHRPVPRPALEAAVPRLVGLFSSVEDEPVKQEWQKAVTALCLVLVVAAREQESVN